MKDLQKSYAMLSKIDSEASKAFFNVRLESISWN